MGLRLQGRKEEGCFQTFGGKRGGLFSLDLFKNLVGSPGLKSGASLPKNMDFIKKSMFFVVFKRLLANLGSTETSVPGQIYFFSGENPVSIRTPKG
jgi:hypothetical protein